jgi:DNA repair exonuclease SbcCD ATPase subunit
MALETVEDIIRALQEHPEWREPLLNALLTDQYRQLPSRADRLEEALARLAEESALTDRRLRELAEQAERRSEELRAALEEHRRETDRQIQEYREKTERQIQEYRERTDRQIQEIRASTEEYRQRAEQQIQEIRASTEEYRQRAEQQIQEIRAETQELRRVHQELDDRTERRFQEVMSEMRSMSRRLDRVEKDLGEVKGYTLEQYYRNNAPAILGRYFRGLKVIDKGEYLQRMQERAPLTDEEWQQLVSADLLLTGKDWQSGADYLLCWEISWVIDSTDVERALQRAQILRRWEPNTAAVVAGKDITTKARQIATQNKVFLVLDTAVLNGKELSSG